MSILGQGHNQWFVEEKKKMNNEQVVVDELKELAKQVNIKIAELAKLRIHAEIQKSCHRESGQPFFYIITATKTY